MQIVINMPEWFWYAALAGFAISVAVKAWHAIEMRRYYQAVNRNAQP